nr:hypothetical protein [Gammaproteobacteria bacterium]
ANMASGFVLRVDGKSTLNLRPANTEEQIRQRLGRIVGSNFADSACGVNARSAGDADGSSSLTGWVGTAASARAQADRQYFFLNARPVRDSVVRHAVRVAYEGVLHDGHHPTFVLFLRVPSASVDVNVHPTKHEVRFREARQVHDFVVSAIRGAISQSPETQARSEYDGPASMGGPVREPPKPWSPGRAQVRETLAGYRALSGGRRSASTDTSASAPLPTDAERGRVLGVVNECLLMQTPQADLGLVDLRALMARSFRRRFEDVRQTEKPQPLLVPAVGAAGDLSGEDVVALGLDVERLGLALRSTGPGQVALSHVPAPLREADTNRILDAVLRFADTRDTQALLAELSALAGQAATGRSPNEYLSELAECDADPFATPLGRRMSGADMRALIAQGPDKA